MTEMAAGAGRRPSRPAIYLAIGLVGVAAALIGFGRTFLAPLLAGSFKAPPIIYVHAILLFSWLLFFAAQSWLTHRRALPRHRTFGWFGAGLIVGVVISTLWVAVLASERTAAGGELAVAHGELFVVQLEMLVFAALIVAALFNRRRPEVHKRLMLLALIASLGPAWFRFRHYFPSVSNPLLLYTILIADGVILLAIGSDLWRRRRVHPVYLTVAPAMVGLHLFEVFGFGSPAFQALADSLAGPFLPG